MSLLQRIPPLVSALAFGYGAGMAAPQSTISSMEAAVTAYHAEPGRPPALPASIAAHPAASMVGRPIGGSESSTLAALRAEGRQAKDGASCDMPGPSASRAPRYESRTGFEVAESDDLDEAGTEALSRLQMPDLRMPVTKSTLKYVHFFTRTDRGRGMFETWLKRSGRYQDMIQAELRERQLPEDLIWVAMIESGFDAKARSPMGAMGLWQFMPATGKVYGLQQNHQLDQRKNPRLATQAAAHHLRDLYARFGQWDLALASYNMGYEQLLDAIDRYGTTDFNELARQEAIPRETSSYVPKIAAAAIVANNLDRFGFEKVLPVKPVDSAEIAVPPGTSLRTLAKAAGISSSQVRTLNPDILGDRVPAGRGDFLLMVPSDTLARAQASLPGLLDTDLLSPSESSVLDPIDLLGGSEPSARVRARGDESLLSLLPPPKSRRRTMRSAMNDEGLAALVDRAGRDDDDVEPRRRSASQHTGRQTVYYRVGPGDTLIGVARQFAADIEDVARDNELEVDAKLRAGALIKLHVRSDVVRLGDGASEEKGADKTSSSDDAKSDRVDAKKDRGASARDDKAPASGKKDAPKAGTTKRKPS